MREIKFRGKRYDNGEWVYGGIIFIDGGEPHIFCNYGGVEVDPATVGQYTGLNDENDYMQWYVNEITDRWSLCIGMDHVEDDPIISKWEGLARHKATAEEIIKHFKKREK